MNALQRYWARYKYTTILAAVVVFVVVAILVPFYHSKKHCDDAGGTYVKTFSGYKCLYPKEQFR